MTDRLAGAYKTSKSSSGVVYDVFHGTGTLTLYSKVAPDSRGECLEPETEQYDKGAGWHADTKYGCDKLDNSSRDTAPYRSCRGGMNTACGHSLRARVTGMAEWTPNVRAG